MCIGVTFITFVDAISQITVFPCLPPPIERRRGEAAGAESGPGGGEGRGWGRVSGLQLHNPPPAWKTMQALLKCRNYPQQNQQKEAKQKKKQEKKTIPKNQKTHFGFSFFYLYFTRFFFVGHSSRVVWGFCRICLLFWLIFQIFLSRLIASRTISAYPTMTHFFLSS